MQVKISVFLPEATCEVSGKTGECVVIETDFGIKDAVVRFSELIKMLRFRAKQEEKQNGEGGQKSFPDGEKVSLGA